MMPQMRLFISYGRDDELTRISVEHLITSVSGFWHDANALDVSSKTMEATRQSLENARAALVVFQTEQEWDKYLEQLLSSTLDDIVMVVNLNSAEEIETSDDFSTNRPDLNDDVLEAQEHCHYTFIGCPATHDDSRDRVRRNKLCDYLRNRLKNFEEIASLGNHKRDIGLSTKASIPFLTLAESEMPSSGSGLSLHSLERYKQMVLEEQEEPNKQTLIEIGNIIRRCRLQLQLPRKKMASRLGIDSTELAIIESGYGDLEAIQHLLKQMLELHTRLSTPTKQQGLTSNKVT